jgi:restriction system protein
MAKEYYRIMLGWFNHHAEECFSSDYIGADFDIKEDLSDKRYDKMVPFLDEFVPKYINNWPKTTKIGAGLYMGNLWTVVKAIKIGDIVLCKSKEKNYLACEVLGDYYFIKDTVLPHRRKVRWFPNVIEASTMSDKLRRSVISGGNVIYLTHHTPELDRLLGGNILPPLIVTDESVEDPVEFALEEHLEEFIVKNWKQIELGKKFDIYEINGKIVGQQYRCDDNSRIDILAISKDKKELLIVELKKGRASDKVIGQIQNYMGFVQEILAENWQTVRGVIIAPEDDHRIRRALKVTRNIEFYKYRVNFKLFKD